MTNRGKATEGVLSGVGGLLLTSLSVNNGSMGELAMEDGGPLSTSFG